MIENHHSEIQYLMHMLQKKNSSICLTWIEKSFWLDEFLFMTMTTEESEMYSHFTGTQMVRKMSFVSCFRMISKEKNFLYLVWMTTIHAHLHIFTAVQAFFYLTFGIFLLYCTLYSVCTMHLCISMSFSWCFAFFNLIVLLIFRSNECQLAHVHSCEIWGKIKKWAFDFGLFSDAT